MNVMRVRTLCNEIDWGELDHAYGFATDIPGLLESSPPAERPLASASCTRSGGTSSIKGDADHGPAYEALVQAFRSVSREDDAARVLARAIDKKLLPPVTSPEAPEAPTAILRSELDSLPCSGPSPDRRVHWLSFEGDELRIVGAFDQIGTMTGCSSLIELEEGRSARLPWPVLRRGRTIAVVTDGRGGFVVGGEWGMTDGREGGGPRSHLRRRHRGHAVARRLRGRDLYRPRAGRRDGPCDPHRWHLR